MYAMIYIKYHDWKSEKLRIINGGVKQSRGVYFNPSNGSLTSDKNSRIYVDRTGLLEYLNGILGTNNKCIALSHARRFGKSHAAGMIYAYRI